jgi:uncharacterized Zn-finger protein
VRVHLSNLSINANRHSHALDPTSHPTLSSEDEIFHALSQPIGNTATTTQQRPYICLFPGCRKAFIRDYTRLRHHITHQDERPFLCSFPGCDKAFKTYVLRTRHSYRYEEIEPSECSFPGCGKLLVARMDVCLRHAAL